MRHQSSGYLRRALLGVLIVVALGLAFVRFAPVYLPPLPPAAPAVDGGSHEVFGYATLANPFVRFVVTGKVAPSRLGVLEGYRRNGRDLLVDPDAHVTGRVFVVDANGLERLDRYEQTGLRYDRRIEELADGTRAWVYRFIE